MDEEKRKALESLPRPSPIGSPNPCGRLYVRSIPKSSLAATQTTGAILPLLERQQRPRTRWFGSDRLPE